jgi:hypothetical protein
MDAREGEEPTPARQRSIPGRARAFKARFGRKLLGKLVEDAVGIGKGRGARSAQFLETDEAIADLALLRRPAEFRKPRVSERV